MNTLKDKVIRLDKTTLMGHNREVTWARFLPSEFHPDRRLTPTYMLCHAELSERIELSPHRRVLYAVFTQKKRKDSFTIVPNYTRGSGPRWQSRMAHIKEHVHVMQWETVRGHLYPNAAMYLMAAYDQGYRYVHFEVAA